jgi:hypothetical protein
MKNHDTTSKRDAFWQYHMRQWSDSGLSQAEYCRNNNLKIKSFGYYKSKFQKRNLPVEFVQISDALNPNLPGLKLNIGSNLQIEIPDGFSRDTLEQTLKTLSVL